MDELNEVLASYKRWNPTAIYCYKSNADCTKCDVPEVLIGYTKHTRCRMPEAVAQLIAKGVPLPAEKDEAF